MIPVDESVIKQAAFAWLEALCYGFLHGPEIALPNRKKIVKFRSGQSIAQVALNYRKTEKSSSENAAKSIHAEFSSFRLTFLSIFFFTGELSLHG